MVMSEEASTKAEHMLKVFELNNMSGRETVKGLLFLNGALLRALEEDEDLTHAMWMNLVSEAVVSAKAPD